MDAKASPSRRTRAAATLLALSAVLTGTALAQDQGSGQGQAQAQVKKPVTTRADLPTFTYPLDGSATALLTSDDATFNAFAAKVGADVDKVLAGYDIKDAATLRELLAVRADVQLLLGQDDAALETFARIRELEDKPDRKLLARVYDEAIIRARKASRGATPEALRPVFSR